MTNFFFKNKYIFYISNIVLIILYLSPCSILGYILNKDCKLQPQITQDFIVSTNHLYAFVIFSIIGYLTFNKSSQFIFLTIYLVFLSIILEILHYFIPDRSFEIPDLFGNLMGVIMIMIIIYFFKKNENIKN